MVVEEMDGGLGRGPLRAQVSLFTEGYHKDSYLRGLCEISVYVP